MLKRISFGLGLSCLIAGFLADPSAQGYPEGYISGVVESSQGLEAGVWVIAETSELQTKFVKIVVTADDGRFVLPQLPRATYDVWVRGYGLADSAPIKASPGDTVTLKAVVARTPQEAAQVYPANYWYSLLEPPAKSEFPGTGPEGNGISPNMTSLVQWMGQMKTGCQQCHQVGNKVTREVTHMSTFDSTVAAWDHRVQTGMRYPTMSTRMDGFGRERGLQMFADWTDRIAAGEVPPAPPRPSGIERNLVVTLWDSGSDTAFQHDMTSTDKRNPRVNPFGPIYAVSNAHGTVDVADPVNNTASTLTIQTRDDKSTIPTRWSTEIVVPSNFYGTTPYWTDMVTQPHNPMIDGQGRVWMTTRIRGGDNPTWCTDGASNKYASYFPLTGRNATRHAGYYDPKTEEWAFVDTCVGTHHLQFSPDENDTLYFSGTRDVMSWVNTKMYDKTGSDEASYGWCPMVLDTNGDGKITKPWNEPGASGSLEAEDLVAGRGGGDSFDPKLDTRVSAGNYGITVNPVDQSVWVASNTVPGQILRFHPGSNPPETCISELYALPLPEVWAKQPGATGEPGYGPRGIDADRSGVIWTALASSGHMASFDRSNCEVRNGPTATGQQCPEGWTFYKAPGPDVKGTDINADFFYYNWVDQFDTLGMGENVPIATGSGSDSLLALRPRTGDWAVLRVPYPLGFYTRGVDGRIDDPSIGWKGRGLWANYGTQFLWHTEGGKGTQPKTVHFQLRPDPLAR